MIKTGAQIAKKAARTVANGLGKEERMDILVLSLVAGLVVAGGVWMATRETKGESDHPSSLKKPGL